MSDAAPPPASQADAVLMLPAPLEHEGVRILQKLGTTNALARHVNDALDLVTNIGAWDADFQQARHAKLLEEVARSLIDLRADAARLEKCTLQASESWRDGVPAQYGPKPVEVDGALDEAQCADAGVGRALKQQIELDRLEWEESTPEQRYGEDPKYRAFREVVWDVLHPNEDCPPIAQLLRQDTAGQGGGGGDDEDEEDDMQMTYATTRTLKCPLTMRTLQKPVKSRLCPHTFEKSAIVQYIRSNGVTERQYRLANGIRMPTVAAAATAGRGRGNRGAQRSATSTQAGTTIPDSQYVAATPGLAGEGSDAADIEAELRAVRVDCPVPGCSKRIGEADLESDRVMLRRLMIAGRDVDNGAGSSGNRQDGSEPPAPTAIYSSDVDELAIGDDDDDEEEEEENSAVRIKRQRRSDAHDISIS